MNDEGRSSDSAFILLISSFGRTHSSNHTFTPSARNRSASGRTTALSFALWLRKTLWVNSSGMAFQRVFTQPLPHWERRAGIIPECLLLRALCVVADVLAEERIARLRAWFQVR